MLTTTVNPLPPCLLRSRLSLQTMTAIAHLTFDLWPNWMNGLLVPLMRSQNWAASFTINHAESLGAWPQGKGADCWWANGDSNQDNSYSIHVCTLFPRFVTTIRCEDLGIPAEWYAHWLTNVCNAYRAVTSKHLLDSPTPSTSGNTVTRSSSEFIQINQVIMKLILTI